MPVITSHYAALLGLLLFALSVQVIRARIAARIALGLGEDRRLLRASRAQGNFVEYVPMILVLMLLAELNGGPGWQLHLVGSMILAGRISHAMAISREPEVLRLRQLGMALTFTALLVSALGLLF